ncbi:MAG: electron transfer flavoprotein subunit beta/FixA family protein [Actinomycetota bacterium]|nr:electron transfer flavoprotein subunit beta/FixA family protein [Actinomycetota bacterium]
MDIVVCIKQVPGTSKVKIDPKTGVLIRSGIDTKMNPYDLFALETAIRIKEEKGGTIKVISMGPPQATDVIKEAYMMGADEGILLSDKSFAGADVLATSYTLSQGIEKLKPYHLIICGKQTTDGDTAQVGPEIAEFLQIPHIANVLNILEIRDDNMVVEMDMPNTIEVARISYPCLITVEKDIFEPRLPSFKKKVSTRDKEIKILGLRDFKDQDTGRYGLNGSPTQVEKVFPPPEDNSQEKWKGNPEETAIRIAEKLKELKYI